MAEGDCNIASATCSKCQLDEHCGSECDSGCEGRGLMGTTSSAMNCTDMITLRALLLKDPKAIKQKKKRELMVRKRLAKECAKKAKKMLRAFKNYEKEERTKYKRRLKQFNLYVKEKKLEDKKCRTTVRKREKMKEKMRQDQQKERYRCLKMQLKMQCVMLGNRNIPLSECDCGNSLANELVSDMKNSISECSLVTNLTQTMNLNPDAICSKQMKMTPASMMGRIDNGEHNKSRSKRNRSQSNAKKILCQKQTLNNAIAGDCVEAHRRVGTAKSVKKAASAFKGNA
uniref:Uncharacterized protein n=1 Tax=Cacopsylla melanoneura TaxID=428564 RepID=A0A8D8W1H6_9HEMI